MFEETTVSIESATARRFPGTTKGEQPWVMDRHLNFELFFDLSPDLLCIAGFDGYFKRVNPAVSRLLGYTEEELYARPIDEFVFEEDRQATSNSRESVRKLNTLFHFENRYVTKSGEIVWLAWTSQPVESEELIFAIAKNITHKKRLETERTTLLHDLTNANHELKQFSLTTSHDLRSPLSNLIMVFDLLDISKVSDEETLQFIEILRLTGISLMKTLDTNVDTLSDAMGGRANVEEVDLEKTLTDVIRSINSLIETTQTTIHTDFSQYSSVFFNRAYLESVFLNLITNAIKYSKPHVPPVISIHSEIVDGSRRLVVADEGIGFDMDKVKDKIFGMNQTFHNHRDSKGVGLYLVHNHVTSLGGKISVESAPGVGTRFTISFRD